MLASLKRLTKHSAVYGVGHIVTRVVNFLLLPLYTNRLPADEFGVYAVVYSYLAMMTIVYTYGIDAAFLRFFILNDDEKKRREIFSTAFWAIVIVSAILTMLIFFNADINSGLVLTEGGHADLFQMVSLVLLFDALSFLPFLYLRAEEKSLYFVALKFLNVLVNVGLNVYYIIYLGKGVEGILLANVWASVITFLCLSPILMRHISFIFSWNEFKELLSFGLPYLPSTLAVVVLDLVDRFILERLAGLEVTGIYSAGYKLGIFMNLFVAAFRFAWHPFFLSTSKEKNAKEIFAKVFTYFTLVTTAIFLVVSLFIDQIVRLNIFGFSLFGPEYWQSTKVVPIILLSYIIYGMYVNFVVGIYLEKKTKYLPLITGAGAVVNILANFLLIPYFGMMGAAYATLIAYVVMAASLYLFSQRLYAIDYEFGRLLKLGAVVALLFFAGSKMTGSFEVLLRCVVILGFPVLLFLTGFFERRELTTLKNILQGKMARSVEQ